MRSNARSIEGKASGLAGYLDATWWGDRLVPQTPALLHIEIPVERVSSGNDIQDDALRRTLSSRSFPQIVAEIQDPVPLATPNRFAANVSVAVRGTTRVARGEVEMRQRDGRVDVDGEQSIDLHDFGITTPRTLWFWLSPEIRLRLHVVAALVE